MTRLYGKLEGPFPKMGHVFIKQAENELCMACGHPRANHVEDDAAATNVYKKDSGFYWDTDCNMSKPALYRFTYALIMVGGHFTCSLTIGCKGYTPQQNARNTAFFRIWLPHRTEAEFERLSGLKVKVPPTIHLS